MTKIAFILNFFKLYNILWQLILPFLKKNRRLKTGFEKRVSSGHFKKADIWIQAASAGEAYLAVQLVKTLVKPPAPQKKFSVLITSITQQGIDIINTHLDNKDIRDHLDLTIEWFPFDIPGVMEQAAARINPKAMILLETEIWPALLWSLKQNSTSIYIVNARVSKKSFSFYHKTRFLWRHLNPDVILATSDQDAERYGQIFEGAKIKTMANIKFESMGEDELKTDIHEKVSRLLTQNRPVTLLASIRKQEESQVLDILKTILASYPEQVVAIFPRHMHRIDAWKKYLNKAGLAYRLRSQVKTWDDVLQIILWDTFGELKAAYDFAHIVFVGGSLEPLGGQNFIEPAVAGATTITGPYYDDFAWAGDTLFKENIVIKKKNADEVTQFILTALEQERNKERTERKKKAHAYIRSRQGGTRKACNEILKAFDG